MKNRIVVSFLITGVLAFFVALTNKERQLMISFMKGLVKKENV